MHVVNNKVKKYLESEQTKEILIRNMHASDWFLNNGIEWANIIAC